MNSRLQTAIIIAAVVILDRISKLYIRAAYSPWDIHLVTLGREGAEERTVAEQLYEELRATGLQVVYDDRDAGPGEKFADAELLGCPLRITIGRRALESGQAEVQVRRGRVQAPGLPLDGTDEQLVGAVLELWRSLP